MVHQLDYLPNKPQKFCIPLPEFMFQLRINPAQSGIDRHYVYEMMAHVFLHVNSTIPFKTAIEDILIADVYECLNLPIDERDAVAVSVVGNIMEFISDYIKPIQNHFERILPNEAMCDYMTVTCCTYHSVALWDYTPPNPHY